MEHYHSMTDAQLAEWHQHVTQIEQLKRDLTISRKAVEAVQAFAEEERRAARAELNRRADLIVDLTMQLDNARSQTRANAAALVVTLRTLRQMYAALVRYGRASAGSAAEATIKDAVANARLTLTEYDIPFGYDTIDPTGPADDTTSPHAN